MTWPQARPWVGTVIRLFLGAVWIWASLSKLANPRTFLLAVRAYDATPEWLSKAIAYGLPVLELVVGVMLVLGILTRIVAAVAGVLFLVFLIGLVQAAARGIQLECGCFGGGGATQGSTNYAWDILRDIGLLVLAAYLVVWAATRFSLDEYLARNDHVEPPSAKRMRTDQGRRKYNVMLEQRRKAARSRTAWVTASLAALTVLIVLIGVGVQSGRSKIAGTLTAKNATVANGVVYGKKAAATIDLYEDFQCPVCEAYEASAGKTIAADVKANKAQLRIHMIAFLDASSNGNKYSTRAANAAMCASDVSVDDYFRYYTLLYGDYKGKKVQPAENSYGRPDADLQTYGKAVGITGSAATTFDSCVSSQTHKALVAAQTDRASEGGVSGTPTVKVNGKKIGNTLAALNKAVAAAAKNGPAPDPSPTPSPKTPASTPASTPATSPAKSSPAAAKPSGAKSSG
ncbi:MauE/DoxX family redox-associated membrane protein [uncultured Jatrophihabitans sp.]|uniref:MauE/DoxX family redox-associated membrane protein n=1 Tax=uncultured Jatrophihabitans sp. TaxID=1610747 RepID=UPI0035C9B59D